MRMRGDVGFLDGLDLTGLYKTIDYIEMLVRMKFTLEKYHCNQPQNESPLILLVYTTDDS